MRSVLKRYKLKIKVGEKVGWWKLRFVPVHTTLASTFTDFILNWLCLADLPANIRTNIQNVGEKHWSEELNLS